MSTPFSKTNMHPNSLEAFNELDLPKSKKQVFDIFKKSGKGLTDRDILGKLTGDYEGDMNLVRPRITDLRDDPTVPITEIGKTVCRFSRMRVRVCIFDPELAGVAKHYEA